VSTTLLLVKKARRYEEIKGCLKGLLGLMVERDETIPAGSSECARRVVETIEVGTEILIRGVLQRNVIELVCLGVVVDFLCSTGRITTHTCAEVVDTTKIGLYFCAPSTLEP
jgi:hypothetical protein